jgi:hypothetical protein
MEAAKQLARLKNQGVGRALSDLARRGLMPETAPTVEMQNGIPVWIHKAGAVTVTREMVRNLADEE